MKYYNKYCRCGCGKRIPIYRHHKYNRYIPNYINHHGMTGKIQKESTKKAIGAANSVANKGKKLKNIHRVGCMCSFCRQMRHEGRPCTKETKLKLRLKRLGKNNGHTGVNHYNWQGGKSFEIYSEEFNSYLKEKIRERDNYKCQECGVLQTKSTQKLAIHHIDYNKQNNNINNLISLCRKCHPKTNYNRKMWEEKFHGLLCNS